MVKQKPPKFQIADKKTSIIPNYKTMNTVTSFEFDDKLSSPNVQSGIKGASANLINSVVGAGIIGIPYAFKQSGLVTGMFLLFIVGYLTDKSLRLLICLASFHSDLRRRNVRTYEDLASYPFGQLGVNFVLINMFLLAYGAMVAYLLIIKDTIPTLFGYDENDLVYCNVIMFITSLCIIVPLSMQRDMASLSLTSTLSVSADIILVVFIVIFSPIQDTINREGGLRHVFAMDSIKSTVFIGLGILSTAMACQHSAFIVSGSLKDRTMRRWSTVTGLSIGVSTALCALLGLCGYLGFLDDTKGDILNNFDAESTLTNGARILLAITMLFTYPMESFVARHVGVVLFHGGDIDGKTQDGLSLLYFGMNRRVAWTFGIYLLTLLPALLVSDIGPVLSITGALGGSCLAYIGPGCVYLGLNGEAFLTMAYKLLGDNYDLWARECEGVMINTDHIINSRCKPIWWYIGGFPIWCRIALIGSGNMNGKLGHYEQYRNTKLSSPTSDDISDVEEITAPTPGDFRMAIFFIVFGIFGAFAGVFSNIYMLLKI